MSETQTDIQELEEIVEFLKNPEKFSTLGGRLPKGVLLVSCNPLARRLKLTLDWPARYWKNDACPSCCRRSRSSFPLRFRFKL